MSFKTPEPPQMPPPPANPPTFADPSVMQAGKAAASRNQGGFGGTIMTSGQGLSSPANTSKKTLIGQ
jgi:hypothetical protein